MRSTSVIFAAIFVILVGGLVGVVTWAKVVYRTDPGWVYSLTGYSKAGAVLLEQEVVRAGGMPDTAPTSLDQLLARAPLSSEPLAFARLVGKLDAPDTLIDTLYRRAPRNELARIWLAQREIGIGALDRAINHLDRLTVLRPERAEQYRDILASLASLPGGVEAISARLESSQWSAKVVSRLNRDFPDMAALLDLNLHTPDTQVAYLNRLIRDASVEHAFLAWMEFVPADERAAFGWPYDPEFQQRAAPPPFNWNVLSDQVEFEPEGGLYVNYFGRGQPRLLEQVMMVRPGPYKFSTRMAGEMSRGGGKVSWRLNCLSGKPLGELTPSEMRNSPATFEFNFTVPDEGCSGQRLYLEGEPGEFATRTRAKIEFATITGVALN